MRRRLTAILSAHWMAVFAVAAFVGYEAASAAIETGGVLPPVLSRFSYLLVAALGHGLVAVLFLWMLVTCLADDTEGPGQADEIASMAFGGAVVMTTVAMVADALAAPTTNIFAHPLQIAALMATWLVMHFEGRRPVAEQDEDEGDSRAAARLMALGAAHSSMLSRIAAPGVPANDDRTG